MRWLTDLGYSTKNMTIENCSRLNELIGSPDKNYKIIHVAGTNGKGSVSFKLASNLRALGHSVGLYTSPHISCYTERIRINYNTISLERMEVIGQKILKLAKKHQIPTTTFEMLTLIALKYFEEEKTEWVILETGLGGRLDATNITKPNLSIITSIGLDHTDVLGDTVEKIAKEKGGIIKPRTPVLIGPTVPFSVIAPLAKNKQAPLFQTAEESNELLVKESLKLLNIPVLEKAISQNLPCRFEQLEGDIILDVAHNPAGLSYLFKQIKTLPKKPLRIVIAFSNRERLRQSAQQLAALDCPIHAVSNSSGYLIPSQWIQEEVPKTSVYSSIQEGVEKAVALASQNDERLLICGSFYMMDDVKQAIREIVPAKAL